MRFCKIMKDGGPESRTWGFFLIEIKGLFSIVFLHFLDGSREAYHTHAFNAVSWLVRGKLNELDIDGTSVMHYPSIVPINTPREKFHRVTSIGDSWAISFRGPWTKNWKEYIPKDDSFITLENGRKITNTIYR